MKQQLKLLTKQAEESDKQSKALMVFTVVTIVFVGGLILICIMIVTLFTHAD